MKSSFLNLSIRAFPDFPPYKRERLETRHLKEIVSNDTLKSDKIRLSDVESEKDSNSSSISITFLIRVDQDTVV